jgi:hypothetical protein
MRNAFTLRATAILFFALATGSAWADNYSDTVEVFKKAVPSSFFEKSYGYAVFPTIGKGGIGVGGAHGKGRVGRRSARLSFSKMNVPLINSPAAISSLVLRQRLSQLRLVHRLLLPPPVIPPVPVAVRTMPSQSVNTSAAWQYSPSPRAA